MNLPLPRIVFSTLLLILAAAAVDALASGGPLDFNIEASEFALDSNGAGIRGLQLKLMPGITRTEGSYPHLFIAQTQFPTTEFRHKGLFHSARSGKIFAVTMTPAGGNNIFALNLTRVGITGGCYNQLLKDTVIDPVAWGFEDQNDGTIYFTCVAMGPAVPIDTPPTPANTFPLLLKTQLLGENDVEEVDLVASRSVTVARAFVHPTARLVYAFLSFSPSLFKFQTFNLTDNSLISSEVIVPKTSTIVACGNNFWLFAANSTTSLAYRLPGSASDSLAAWEAIPAQLHLLSRPTPTGAPNECLFLARASSLSLMSIYTMRANGTIDPRKTDISNMATVTSTRYDCWNNFEAVNLLSLSVDKVFYATVASNILNVYYFSATSPVETLWATTSSYYLSTSIDTLIAMPDGGGGENVILFVDGVAMARVLPNGTYLQEITSKVVSHPHTASFTAPQGFLILTVVESATSQERYAYYSIGIAGYIITNIQFDAVAYNSDKFQNTGVLDTSLLSDQTGIGILPNPSNHSDFSFLLSAFDSHLGVEPYLYDTNSATTLRLLYDVEQEHQSLYYGAVSDRYQNAAHPWVPSNNFFNPSSVRSSFHHPIGTKKAKQVRYTPVLVDLVMQQAAFLPTDFTAGIPFTIVDTVSNGTFTFDLLQDSQGTLRWVGTADDTTGLVVNVTLASNQPTTAAICGGVLFISTPSRIFSFQLSAAAPYRLNVWESLAVTEPSKLFCIDQSPQILFSQNSRLYYWAGSNTSSSIIQLAPNSSFTGYELLHFDTIHQVALIGWNSTTEVWFESRVPLAITAVAGGDPALTTPTPAPPRFARSEIVSLADNYVYWKSGIALKRISYFNSTGANSTEAMNFCGPVLGSDGGVTCIDASGAVYWWTENTKLPVIIFRLNWTLWLPNGNNFGCGYNNILLWNVQYNVSGVATDYLAVINLNTFEGTLLQAPLMLPSNGAGLCAVAKFNTLSFGCQLEANSQSPTTMCFIDTASAAYMAPTASPMPGLPGALTPGIGPKIPNYTPSSTVHFFGCKLGGTLGPDNMTCIVNGSVHVNSSVPAVGIDMNVTIIGDYTQDPNATLGLLYPNTITVQGCASFSGNLNFSSVPFVPGTSQTVFEYGCYSGQFENIHLPSGGDDPCKNYIASPQYGEHSLTILFDITPKEECAPGDQGPETNGLQLSQSQIVGLAVGITVGVLVVFAAMAVVVRFVPALRHRVMPFTQRKDPALQKPDYNNL